MLAVFDVFALHTILIQRLPLHEIEEQHTVTYEAPEYDDWLVN